RVLFRSLLSPTHGLRDSSGGGPRHRKAGLHASPLPFRQTASGGVRRVTSIVMGRGPQSVSEREKAYRSGMSRQTSARRGAEEPSMADNASRVTIHMAASLDGFIARKDGSVDWMETSDEF